jgi:hypothetical protein
MFFTIPQGLTVLAKFIRVRREDGNGTRPGAARAAKNIVEVLKPV